MFDTTPNIPIQELKSALLSVNNVQLFILRDDLLHSEVSGNKWRKLKYNIESAKALKSDAVVTFGGAFSNHIAATAAAGRIFNIKTHGVIRGEEIKVLNSTLQKAQADGMTFSFVSRSDYQNKELMVGFHNILNQFDAPFIIPEGGGNSKGVKGCSEIIPNDFDFDLCAVACGTGGTMAGVVSALKAGQAVLGFPALKNAGFLLNDISAFLKPFDSLVGSWSLNLDYHFGGYAKKNNDLIEFIKSFYQEYNLKLDPIYTGKAMFGLLDLIKKGQIKNQKILFIHTGGLQGINGFEDRYKLTLFD